MVRTAPREQQRQLIALSAPTLVIIVLGVVTISRHFGQGNDGNFYLVIKFVLLAVAFFVVFELGRLAARLQPIKDRNR